jgi:hypothetical protein
MFGESVRHELPLFKMPFNKTMSSGVKFQPDNCPGKGEGIEMQIEISRLSVYNLNIFNLPMLESSGSLSISSSIVAIVKLDADVNQMSSNLLKS